MYAWTPSVFLEGGLKLWYTKMGADRQFLQSETVKLASVEVLH